MWLQVFVCMLPFMCDLNLRHVYVSYPSFCCSFLGLERHVLLVPYGAAGEDEAAAGAAPRDPRALPECADVREDLVKMLRWGQHGSRGVPHPGVAPVQGRDTTRGSTGPGAGHNQG